MLPHQTFRAFYLLKLDLVQIKIKSSLNKAFFFMYSIELSTNLIKEMIFTFLHLISVKFTFNLQLFLNYSNSYFSLAQDK